MRLRLFLSFALIVLLTAFSLLFLTARNTRNVIDQFVNRGGITGNQDIVEMLEEHYAARGTWAGAEKFFKRRHRGPNNDPGGRPDPGGQKLVLTDPTGLILITNDIPPEAGPVRFESNPQTRVSDDELTYAIPLYNDGEVVGYLLPEYQSPFLANIEENLRARLGQTAATTAAIAGFASLIFALAIAWLLMRPIRTLTAAAGNLARGDLSQRVPVHGSDEIANLSHTFNQMAESLQQAELRRKALTADIAHELRNPLAVQRANLEALQDDIYPLTKENLTPILEQTLLLERLVEDLRTLALADAGQLSLTRVSTDFGKLIQRAVAEISPAADTESIEIILTPQPDCAPLLLDAARVQQILGNLLSNAMKHTPRGGRIHVNLTCTPNGARLTVLDSGAGIPPDDLPHIFERFFRGDQARSRAGGSTGLGLSIARRIAEAHGGTLTADNHPDGGAQFTLTLPAP